MPQSQLDTFKPKAERPFAPREWVRWLPLFVVLTGAVAYLNSFSAGFVWDDTHDIILNRRVQSLWSALEPPWGGGSYRPVVYLSFALNYAWGGVTEVWGYRAVNLAVHLAAGVVLFGLIRRTLLLPVFAARFERSAAWIALAAALLWTVHPLQTESVTYIVHRYESFMGLFYLLTLYCVLRGASSEQQATAWYVAAVVACALGMGSKEVMITAPILVLAYDRIFLAGSWREVFSQRRGLYAGLAATWLLLWFQILGAFSGKEQWAGFQNDHLKPLPYALSQPGVILYYLRLALWPQDLCVDLGWPVAQGWSEIVVPALVIGVLLAGTGFALVRKPWLGFLGLWFFGILAVTSSIMPVADLAAERRMYLPLAAVIILLVLGAFELLEKARRQWNLSDTAISWTAGLVLGVATLALVVRTSKRNEDYYTEEAIWRQVVAQRPGNPRAHANLGTVLLHKGNVDEAFAALHMALDLNPSARTAHRSLGMALDAVGKDDEAQAQLAAAVTDDPDDAQAHYYLGKQFQKHGNLAEAESHYDTALRLNPQFAEARYKRGTLLAALGRPAEAKLEYLAAISLNPDLAEPYDDLAVFFWTNGEFEGALRNWHRALAGDARLASAHNNLGAALALQGRLDEAMPHLAEAIARNPKLAQDRTPLGQVAQLVRDSGDRATAHERLGQRLFQQGRRAEAKAHYLAALKEKPGFAAAHDDLAMVLWLEGNSAEAVREWNRAVELDPRRADSHNHLGAALALQDKLDEALKHLDEAVRLDPKLADAQHHRAMILARSNRLEEAARAYRSAVELRPKNADYRCGLAETLQRLGNVEAARKEYAEAIRADPIWPQRTLRDAWELSVHPEERRRNARRALQLAQRVCAAVGQPGAIDLDVLAAAYAENGRFNDAVTTAQQAVERAQRDGLKNLVGPIETRLSLYRTRKPFRASVTGAMFPGNE